jgi:hypothetical protein
MSMAFDYTHHYFMSSFNAYCIYIENIKPLFTSNMQIISFLFNSPLLNKLSNLPYYIHNLYDINRLSTSLIFLEYKNKHGILITIEDVNILHNLYKNINIPIELIERICHILYAMAGPMSHKYSETNWLVYNNVRNELAQKWRKIICNMFYVNMHLDVNANVNANVNVNAYNEILPFTLTKPHSMAVFINDPNIKSSDYKASLFILHVAKKLNYHTTVITPCKNFNKIGSLFDDYISITFDNPINALKTRYKIAVFVNHVASYEFCASLKYMPYDHNNPNISLIHGIGDLQINIMGNLISSGLDLKHTNSIFIVPEFEKNTHYTEKIKQVTGMGCTLPCPMRTLNPFTLNSTQINIIKTTIKIACPLTANKINTFMSKIIIQINEKFNTHLLNSIDILNEKTGINLPPKKILFKMHYGMLAHSQLKNELDAIHFAPFMNNYISTSDDIEQYNLMIKTADLILCAFPYTPFISAIDIIKNAIPAIVLYDNTRLSTSCAGKIFELFNLNECICYSVEECIDKAMELILNSKLREQIKLKMQSIDYESVIKKHNIELENSFEKILLEF